MKNTDTPTLAAMVAENQQRIATYFRPYDPEKGDAEQQVTARQRVMLQDTEYWLPTAMVVRWPSLADGKLTDVARALWRRWRRRWIMMPTATRWLHCKIGMRDSIVSLWKDATAAAALRL